jgi:uncharacterized damage-inducible protein DinB
MRKLLGLTLAAILVPAALAAQAADANPVTSAVKQIMQRDSKILSAAASEMPADKFGYHPTPAQMTFGHLVLHIAQSNNYMCGSISGEKAPVGEKLTETSPKEKLVAALDASFKFCDAALAKVDDSKLTEQVPFFGGRTVSRAMMLIELTDDWSDHYSQAANYLRMNGLLPPTARRSSM